MSFYFESPKTESPIIGAANSGMSIGRYIYSKHYSDYLAFKGWQATLLLDELKKDPCMPLSVDQKDTLNEYKHITNNYNAAMKMCDDMRKPDVTGTLHKDYVYVETERR